MNSFGARPLRGMKNSDGSILLSHADFDAYEGSFERDPYLRFHLCTAHVGHLCRQGSDGMRLEGVLRPGTFGVSLPNMDADGYWPRTEAVAIMVHSDRFSEFAGEDVTLEDMIPAASTLHRDPLVTSVLSAMWRDAEAHGLSSAFFDAGLSVVINRLAEQRHKSRYSLERPDRPLTGPQFDRVRDWIETHLDGDIRVKELAELCGRDVRSFTRSFRATTGYTPYQYLTLRRLHLSTQLMLQGDSITEISMAVGYSNPSKFSAAFRRAFGCSPSQWRQDNMPTAIARTVA